MITLVANKNIFKVNDDVNGCFVFDGYEKEREAIIFNMEHPLDNLIKDECPGFIFGEFIDYDGPRKTINMKSMNRNWITFDIDNKLIPYSIEEFKRDFSEYEYYLYTSSNHLKDGKKDRFRVFIRGLLPEVDITNDDERGFFKKYMSELYPWADVTSFEANRIFYCPNKNKNPYMFIVNEGKQLIIDELDYEEKLLKSKEKTNKLPSIQTTGNRNMFLKHLIKKMDERIASGSTYTYLVKFIAACKHNNICALDIYESLQHTDAKISDIKRLLGNY